MTNKERAQRAEAALSAYPGRVISGIGGERQEDLSATIVNLVTDLMHLAHQNDIEPDYVARVSADHYTAEVGEEAEVPPLPPCPEGYSVRCGGRKRVLDRMIEEQRKREP